MDTKSPLPMDTKSARRAFMSVRSRQMYLHRCIHAHLLRITQLPQRPRVAGCLLLGRGTGRGPTYSAAGERGARRAAAAVLLRVGVSAARSIIAKRALRKPHAGLALAHGWPVRLPPGVLRTWER